MKKKLKIFMVLSLVLISVPFLNINADESNTNQEVSTPITETEIDNDTTGEVCADNNDDSPCDELPETEQENESEDVIDDVTDGETELDPVHRKKPIQMVCQKYKRLKINQKMLSRSIDSRKRNQSSKF
ncbi:hypothetical protein MGH68_01820 [Erysipelothrix sp. D19-032]